MLDTLRSQECDAVYQEGKKKPPVPLPGLACSCCSRLRHYWCNGLRPSRALFLHKRKLLLSTTKTFWLSEAVQQGFCAVKASFPCFSSGFATPSPSSFPYCGNKSCCGTSGAAPSDPHQLVSTDICTQQQFTGR